MKKSVRLSALLVCCSIVVVSANAQPVTQPFTFSLVGHSLPHVHHGHVSWADVDGDGEISYQDLQKAFGSVLNPPENFYFR